MADYLITWVDYAYEQYLALGEVSAQLNARLRRLAQQPKDGARYDSSTDRWSAQFDAGRGFLVYIVNDEHQRIVILRIVYLG